MDPNETLRMLRERVADALNDRDYSPIRVAILFEALDEWLSKGGFLPDDWRYVQTGQHTSRDRDWPQGLIPK